jgi:hypothetical protein
MQGYINTEYRYRLSKGLLIQPTPWLQYTSDYNLGAGAHDVHSTSANFRYYWSPSSPFDYWYSSMSKGWPDKLDLLALATSQDCSYYVQAAAANLYSKGWDELTFAAEFAKTVAMFRGFTSRLIELARKGKLESMWLESRYGWRTLIYDLKDIDKAIQNLNGNKKRFFERAGTNVNVTVSNNYDSTAPAWCNSRITVVTEQTMSLRGSIAADISPPRFQINPLTTAWELTRLSFVVDWVLNIGQFLESVSFLVLSREHYAAQGVKIERKKTLSGSVLSWKSGFSGQHFCSASSFETATYRTPSSVSYIPQLKLRLDGAKVLDLAALLIQTLSKSKLVGKATNAVDYYMNGGAASKERERNRRRKP